MTDEKRKSASGNFVICDVQEEYSSHLLKILAEEYGGAYQFQLFSDIEKMSEFLEKNQAEVLLIGEEYGEEHIQKAEARCTFILTGIPGMKSGEETRYVFRYQSGEEIIRMLRRKIHKNTHKNIYEKNAGYVQGKSYVKKKSGIKIRDEPPIRGLIGVYSPVHRIGKTKFAIRMGQKIAKQIPVLYINMEGYSGGGYYFQEGQDLGDLFYFLKQEQEYCGLKITAMTGQKGGMDYILPMKNEHDVRSVRKEEWISLFDMILEKCIYETVILDLGDAIDGLYDILRKCSRIYTPYICEGAAEAKLEQYEENLRTAGYADILRRTVKRQVGRDGRQSERIG